MSNKNVWKTNWNASPNKNDDLDPTNNYRSIRSTGNRYSRYAPNHNNDKNSTQSILQRAKLPKTHTLEKNNGYGHNTYNQGLPFHTVLQQQPQSQSIQSQPDDDDKDIAYLPNMALDHDHPARPPPLPSDPPSSNNRFPQNSPHASPDKKPINAPLSSTGKWRSRRAEKLKKNPHQKHPYSSKPIPSNREHVETTSAELSAVSPTTYKDSRFTRFAQEQLNHSSHTNTSSIGNNTSPTRKQCSVDKQPNNQINTAINAIVPVNNEGEQWFYKDPSGQEQGPFVKSQMSQWFNDGYFPQDLPIRCNPATPFVQLKDWFLQGMTAFLEEIPTQWPQTNEQVIINPNVCGSINRETQDTQEEEDASVNLQQDMDIESDVAINNKTSSYTQYAHNTPPSSNNEEFTTPVKALFDDVENTTNKSSTAAGDDSFYDASSTRMASIHPRPNIHEQSEINMNMNMNMNGEDLNDDKMNMNQDEALDYYLDNKNEDAMNEYDYNKYNKYDYDTNPGFIKEKYVEVNDHTPPPMHAIHAAHSYHHHPTATATNKLTPLSAYDQSLAATPPAQYPANEDEYHEDEYNYTPSTNPEHNEEDETINLPLFRSNTDPTDYHHINTSDVDMLQQSTSDPKDNSMNSHHNNKNLYDPFGGQDLFANGRRNLALSHPAQIAPHHAYNNMQQQQLQGIHQKYATDTRRKPMKRVQNEIMINNNEAVSIISTTPNNTKQPRDRKPPIRHKWPHHFMANTQMQFEQMMVKQPMNVDVVSSHSSQHKSNVTHENNNNVHNERYPANNKITSTQSHDSQLKSSTERSHTKKRKRRKKKHNKTNKTNANNDAPNAWGAKKRKPKAQKTHTKPSFMELQAKDAHEQQQIKRKQREDIKRRQDVIKQQKQQQLLQKQVKQQQQQQLLQKQKQEQEQKMYHEADNGNNPWQTNAVTKNNKSVTNNNNNNNTNKGNKQSTKSKKKKTANKEAVTSSISSTWSSRAKGSASNAAVITQSVNQLQNSNRRNNNNNNNANNKSRKNKQTLNKAAKNRNVNNTNNNNNNIGNNRNIEAVNKVSAELQNWLRTEIKKLNADVEAASVAHLLLTLDDDTAKTTAYHTFGSSKEVNTFIDSFLVHRNHDMQKTKKVNHSQQKKIKKKGKKTRR